jgi:hypothetical protein
VVKAFLKVIAYLHGLIAVILAVAALLMIASAVHTAWTALGEGFGEETALTVIGAVGLVAVAIVALQIAQTIAEEEVIRDAHVSAPTRVRRFLSRFLVVITVALSIEGLIATFNAIHEDAQQLYYAAALVAAVGLLLAGWGAFIWFNRAAEDVEPEAMEEAKDEDKKLK